MSSYLRFLIRTVIVALFSFFSKRFFDIEVSGLENDPETIHTYLAISHKRDLDSIVSIPPLFFHRGRRALAGEIQFALRADAFERGYLARLLPRPRWLSHLLYPISLGPFLHWVGAHPIEQLTQRAGTEWVRHLLQVEGDVRASEAFTPAFVRELASSARVSYQQLAGQHLSRLLTWRYFHALLPFQTLDILLEPVRRRMERYLALRIKQEISDLGVVLWNGNSLFTAPEGQLSPTGTLSPINSGLHRLLRLGPPDLTILPIYIMYDFMTTQRPAIFIDVAPPIPHAPSLSNHELDAQLQATWRGNAHFTCTQLGSGFLVAANRTRSTFTLDDAVNTISEQAARLVEAGRKVDERLLQPQQARERVQAFLRYAERLGLIQSADSLTWKPTAGDMVMKVRVGETGYGEAPLVYAWNELQDLLSVP
ncbi:MAG TPA: hypothetical protein VKV40_22365 [Ktedonobacteraceae bacterium]|nr:hypothetical protein [Ktedonobacteraceae bacterium]